MRPQDIDAAFAGARRRFEELRDQETFERFRAKQLAAAVSVSQGRDDFPRTIVSWAEEMAVARADAALDSGPVLPPHETGRDAASRATFQRLAGHRPGQLFVWDDQRRDTVISLTDDPVISQLRSVVMEGDRCVLEFDFDSKYLPEPTVAVTQWVYDERGLAVMAVQVRWSEGGFPRTDSTAGWSSSAERFVVDESGRLQRVDFARGRQQVGVGGSPSAALSEARPFFDDPTTWLESQVRYDGRIAGLEDELPEPERAFEGMVPALVDDLVRVAEQADLGELAFIYVDFDPLPPAAGSGSVSLKAATDAWTQRARLLTEGSRDLVLSAGRWYGGTPELDALSGLSEPVARQLRAGRLALNGQHPGLVRRREHAVRGDLAEELNRREWPAALPDFLAVVHEDFMPSSRDEEPFPLTRAAVGEDRYQTLIETLTPRKRPRLARDLRAADVADLATTLMKQGLTALEAERVAADARWAIRLEPDPAGTSRIGGSAFLHRDASWPATRDGRPLCHLATVALDELPDVPDREALPDTGYLSFFADLTDDDQLQLIEPVEPDSPNRDQVAIIHTLSGDGDVRRPPVTETALGERPCRPVARLQLRPLFTEDAERLYGLDGLAADVLTRVAERANGQPVPQLLGWPDVVQGDPRDDHQVALLHLPHDAKAGFDILDAGDLLFYADPDNTRTLDSKQVTVWPSSN